MVLLNYMFGGLIVEVCHLGGYLTIFTSPTTSTRGLNCGIGEPFLYHVIFIVGQVVNVGGTRGHCVQGVGPLYRRLHTSRGVVFANKGNVGRALVARLAKDNVHVRAGRTHVKGRTQGLIFGTLNTRTAMSCKVLPTFKTGVVGQLNMSTVVTRRTIVVTIVD